MPEIANAAISSSLPLFGGPNVGIDVEGAGNSAAKVHDISEQEVSPAYFRVMETPLRTGRWFNERDTSESEWVAVVSESLVAKYFANADPLGRRIRISDGGAQRPWLTIVGVVADQKRTSVLHEMQWMPSATVYQPLAQQPAANAYVLVRTLSNQAAIGRVIAREINAIDRDIPVDVEALSTSITKFLAYPKFRAAVFVGFATFALLLAALGLHGILQQYVSQRTREIGVRMAVGARRIDILRLVVTQGGLPLAAGLAVGVAMSVAISRYLSGLLYEARATDPSMLVIVTLPLILVAVLAGSIPAQRAASVDPIVALRDE
jgi:predicted permease